MLIVDPATYAAFIVAVGIIVIVPGPDHVYLGAVSLRDGRRAGIIAAAGMAVSMMIHTLVAVTGVGAALAAVPSALVVIRIAGAFYLAVLGAVTLRRRADAEHHAPPTGRIFTRAMVVNLTNPKIVIFFLAFLPQFVSTDRGAVPLQLVVLGISFVVLGFVVDAVYALGGALLRRLLGDGGLRQRTLGTITGTVYLVLAAAVLVSLAVESGG